VAAAPQCCARQLPVWAGWIIRYLFAGAEECRCTSVSTTTADRAPIPFALRETVDPRRHVHAPPPCSSSWAPLVIGTYRRLLIANWGGRGTKMREAQCKGEGRD